VFFDLLSTSRDVAQKGIKLMQNVSYLCGKFLEPTKDLINLKEFIQAVMPEVEEAQHKSINVKTNFRMIMVTFTEVGRRQYITICGAFPEDFGKPFFPDFQRHSHNSRKNRRGTEEGSRKD
jgi:hypothetical protein